MKTRAFKSGNSQAVRIPAEIAFKDMNEELEVTRSGDTVIIRPARGSMREAIELLRRLPKPEPWGPIERIQPRKTLWD
jgi:antitoxin VapB